MITKISLRNIRCFEEKEISFPNSLSVFLVGENGAGKTTILESILLPAHGLLYGIRPSHFIKRGAKDARVSIRWVDRNVNHEVTVNLGERFKEVFVDKKRQTSSLIKKIMNFSWFFPQDILLAIGSPEERRNFLDETISRAYSKYKDHLNFYKKVVRQRNVALKRDASDSEIDVYDQQIASVGAKIIEQRLLEIKRLNEIFSEITRELTGYESFIRHRSTVLGGEDIETSLMEMLYVSRETDKKDGVTSVGPHRDCFEIIFNQRNSRNAASYGERKIISLALKLSQRKYLEEIFNRKVAFIADDLFSELDYKRRQLIMDYLSANAIYYIASATERPIGSKSQLLAVVEIGKGKCHSSTLKFS